jgi:hypothetical protein
MNKKWIKNKINKKIERKSHTSEVGEATWMVMRAGGFHFTFLMKSEGNCDFGRKGKRKKKKKLERKKMKMKKEIEKEKKKGKGKEKEK